MIIQSTKLLHPPQAHKYFNWIPKTIKSLPSYNRPNISWSLSINHFYGFERNTFYHCESINNTKVNKLDYRHTAKTLTPKVQFAHNKIKWRLAKRWCWACKHCTVKSNDTADLHCQSCFFYHYIIHPSAGGLWDPTKPIIILSDTAQAGRCFNFDVNIHPYTKFI